MSDRLLKDDRTVERLAPKVIQDIDITLLSIANGDGAPGLAWASVALSIGGIDIAVHGCSIVRDGTELVCRTPHHRRDGKWAPSIEVPGKIAAAIAEVVFAAYNRGLAVAPPARLPTALQVSH